MLTRKAYLTNARKIYTVTVGRVSWNLQDLAQQFDAQCQTTYNLDCLGLTFPLTNSSKHLVVGRQYLPLSNLRSYSGSSYMWTPLAKIKRDSGFGGDFAFKKAFKQSNWPEDLNGTSCKSSREEYIVSSLDNHLYTQHSLQPAYTASLMWLFQYGTANDEIDISKGKTSLAFAANVVNNRVVMSTPTNSSYLTYFACGLILGITMWVTAKSQRNRGVQTPREVSANTVAQVLLNEMHYPPAFVKCMVLPPEKQPLESGRRSHYVLLRDEPEDLQDFSISGVNLQHRDNPELCQPLPDARD